MWGIAFSEERSTESRGRLAVIHSVKIPRELDGTQQDSEVLVSYDGGSNVIRSFRSVYLRTDSSRTSHPLMFAFCRTLLRTNNYRQHQCTLGSFGVPIDAE